VQAARDAARRSACTNNMRQLGLALFNYHDSKKIFPSSSYALRTCTGANVDKTRTLNASGWTSVLPFLELGPISTQYDYNQCASTAEASPVNGAAGPLAGDPVTTSNNGKVISTKLAVFMCPADMNDPLQIATGQFYAIKDGSGLRGARTSYEFATNCSVVCNFWRTAATNVRHMFGENSRTTLADVRDGTSNTIMICETTMDVFNGNGTAWGYRGWVMNGVDPSCTQQTGRGINIWYRATTPQSVVPGQLGSWSWPGSLHPGGCHFIFADNSVHFLSDGTAFTVLDALAKIADSRGIPGGLQLQ
jgi:hypothetical protein